jgi:alternate signal-mediated exported protein
MSKRVKGTVAALCAAALLAGGAGTAFAVGGPNEAGNSGKFHPGSNACANDNNHPNCSGPK